MNDAREILTENVEGRMGSREVSKMMVALVVLVSLFSFVVLPGSVAAADQISTTTWYIIIAIVAVALIAIVAIILMSGKGEKAAPASEKKAAPAAKAAAPAAAAAAAAEDWDDFETGHYEDGKCSKCGAPMMKEWDNCPHCMGKHYRDMVVKMISK